MSKPAIEKKQKQEAYDSAKFLTKPEEKALNFYLNFHREINYIQKHYPSLLINL